VNGSSSKFENLKIKDLATLKLLLELKSVTKVADRLGISQPALSRWFSKIRDCFQDPFLVRIKHEMILTPVAETFLFKLEQVEPMVLGLVPREFDPTSSSVEFSIAAPDYVIENVFKDVLFGFLSDEYKISFRFLPWTKYSKNELVQGNIHLAVSLDNNFPPSTYHRTIDDDYLVCVAGKGHPLCQLKSITISDLLKYAHVIPATGGGWVNRLRRLFEPHGELKEKVFTASYNAAFAIVGATQLITIAPNHVVRNSSIIQTLSIHEFPLFKARLEYGFFWHEKYQSDPSHIWLRKKLFPLVCTHKKQLHSLEDPLLAENGFGIL
jgi:DNA-binding transcriptional LysR family regulator